MINVSIFMVGKILLGIFKYAFLGYGSIGEVSFSDRTYYAGNEFRYHDEKGVINEYMVWGHQFGHH